VEERDGRNKRSSGRDRRSGVLDDGKEKDERKDRDRDRERDKEPAWMDTYIPGDSGAEMLGGKGGEGELDGIQVFKKGMRAKEQKDAPPSLDDTRSATSDRPSGSPNTETAPPTALASGKPLDEIQLFKLMMKKEQDQKASEKNQALATEPTMTGPTLQEVESRVSGLTRVKDQRKSMTIPNGTSTSLNFCLLTDYIQSGEAVATSASESRSALDQPPLAILPTGTSIPSAREPTSQTNSDTPQALLSILSSATNGARSAPLHTSVSTASSIDTAPPKTGSRFFPKPLPSDASSPIVSDQGSSSSQAPPQFNPPPGSRLLAFGARSTSGTSGPQNINQPPSQSSHSIHPSAQQHQTLHSSPDGIQSAGMLLPQSSDINHRPAMSEAMRAQQGFSPFEVQARTTFGFDESREHGNHGHTADSLRRTSVTSSADRIPLSVTSDSNMGNNYFNTNSDPFTVSPQGPPFDPISNGSQYASGKGSRFLKYFEEKGRDGQVGSSRKPQGPVGFQSSSPNLGQRQDHTTFNSMPGGQGDNRTVDELFAMLNTSVQVCH
jgi:zinc finger CCCH domain-containing protein 13